MRGRSYPRTNLWREEGTPALSDNSKRVIRTQARPPNQALYRILGHQGEDGRG